MSEDRLSAYREKRDDEIKIVLHGSRVSGRYVLIHIRDQWLMHRMDPPEPVSDQPAS